MVLAANALGTELRNRGFSRAFLHSFAERLIFEPFPEVLAELLNLLERPASKFRCVVPVNWPAFADDVVQLAQGSVHKTLPDIGSSPEAREFKSTVISSADRFFVTEIEARDQYAAAHAAALSAGQVMNLAVLYTPNKRLEVPRRPTLVQSGTAAFLVAPDLSHESYIRDSRRVADKLSRMSPRVMNLLSAPLQYHALGVQATAPESRLTNFWVALEALLVEHDGSIIEKITEYIPPSLALSYSGRLLRANAIELVRFIQAGGTNGQPEAGELRTLFTLPSRGRVSIESAALAELLFDESRAKHLFTLCAKNPLLIFRLNQTRDKIKDPKKLKAAIERHRQRVGWQLKRIYRARNSLVHRGTLPPRAELLVQHLHTYLSTTLHYLVKEIGDSKLLTVTAAFARRRALYDAYLSKVNERTLTFRNLTNESTCWLSGTDTDSPIPWKQPQDSTATRTPVPSENRRTD